MSDKELHITDSNWKDHYYWRGRDYERRGKGLIPRDYDRHPTGSYARGIHYGALDIPLIPENEWSDRIKEKVATKSQLSDVRMAGNNGQMIPSLDQDGKGYCWAHSSTSASTILRAVMGLPYVGLSAYAIACIEKSFQDEGGWGAESMDFICARGVPSYALWPAQSMNRSNDNPKTWENAALHKVSDGWIDLAAQQYDRNLSWQQVASLLLSGVPVVVDYNWWSHSVCAIDLVEIEKGSFGVRIWNSWGDDWSQHGMGTLEEGKAHPDGSVAPLITRPSVTFAGPHRADTLAA